MTKKEFEKETYLAPEWGLRVVTVERRFLQASKYSEDGTETMPEDGEDDF